MCEMVAFARGGDGPREEAAVFAAVVERFAEKAALAEFCGVPVTLVLGGKESARETIALGRRGHTARQEVPSALSQVLPAVQGLLAEAGSSG